MPKDETFVPLGPRPYAVPRYEEGDEVPPQPQERIAHAIEYIVVQMGSISENLREIIERLDALGRTRP